LSNADILRTRDVLHMRTSAAFGEKTLQIFRNLWCVHMEKGGCRASAEIFRTIGRGSIFPDIVRTSFMDGPLRSIWKYEQLATNVSY